MEESLPQLHALKSLQGTRIAAACKSPGAAAVDVLPQLHEEAPTRSRMTTKVQLGNRRALVGSVLC